MAQGWIKIHRELMQHWLWDDRPFARGQAFIDLLMTVNHEDHRFLLGSRPETVRKGSTITSIRKLAERWGWLRKKVAEFLGELEADGMISRKSDTKKTVITIENYSVYQEKGGSRTAAESRSGDTEEPLTHTNKNEKKKENRNGSGEDPEPSEKERRARISALRK